jgi:hypothetical protein
LAKDKVIICIKNVNIVSLYNYKSLWRAYSKKAFTDKYKHRVSFYTHGAMICNIDIFNINYSRYSSTQGDIFLSFSVATLYNGNNSIPKGNISNIDLVKRIGEALSNVLYMDKLPPSNTWKVTKDECNIDVIDSIENIHQRFALLKKMKIPYRKIDCSLADKGTIYFHSGKDRKKCSSTIVIYDKVKEQKHRGNDIHRLLDLDDGLEVLRIEVVDKRYTLNKKVKKVVKMQMLRERSCISSSLYKKLQVYNASCLYNRMIEANKYIITTITSNKYDSFFKKEYSEIFIDFNEYVPQLDYIIPLQDNIKNTIDFNVNSLNTVMSKQYQFTVINDFIVQCGFDKIITTKEKLYKIIDNNSLFTKAKRKTAKRVIRFLNEGQYTISLNDRTIKMYIKLILSTGYHFLYAAKELKPITSDEILISIDQDKNINMTC